MLKRHTFTLIVWLLASLLVLPAGELGMAEGAANTDSDWSIQCKGLNDNCSMYAEIRLSSGVLFSSIEIRKFGNRFGGIMKLPLGTHVPSGYMIGIDRNTLIEAKLISCQKTGCSAAFALNNEEIVAFKRGLRLSIVFTRNDTRRKVALNYSLTGFTKVWSVFQSLLGK